MGTVAQNGWDQLGSQYTTLVALSLLYYDYALTFDRERRLFWSRDGFKQWGSILFFLNRYCGIIGHGPVVVQVFVRLKSASYPLCHGLHKYHQMLAIIMQTIAGFTFIARTYALYDRSRVVLIGLMSLALVAIAVAGYMITRGERLSMNPELPKDSVGCSTGLSWSQAWGLAVAWSGVMIFDFVVFVMTLLRTIQINRRSGKDRTLIHVLIRDGVMYFGVINLVTMSNIISFLRGSEITRGVPSIMTNILACVLVSRLMFNLREPRGRSSAGISTITADTSSAPMSTTVLLHTLTNVGDVDEPAVYESRDHSRDIEMVRIDDHSKRIRHVGA